MADPRTLLQRLHRPEPPPGRDEELLARSVRDNLQDLFNTAPGSALSEPDYGLPDLSVLVRGLDQKVDNSTLNQPGIEAFKAELLSLISRFEPRLKLERIDAHVDELFHLRFEMRARLILQGQERGRFSANAEVDPAGRLRVS